MLKSCSRKVIGVLFTLTFCVSPSYVSADDASDIQAVVTSYVTKQGIQQPGVFYNFSIVENAPYASVQTGLGSQGYSSESFALSKGGNGWQVLLHGGGVMGVSEFVTVGIPLANAKNLQGFGCRGALRKTSSSTRLAPKVTRITQTFLDPNVARKLMRSNNGMLPTRRVSILISGKRQIVNIMQPIGYSRDCLF